VIVFFLLAACLVVLVLVLLLPTLTRSHQSADRREVNVAIARAQLAELAQKQADGELADAEFADEKLRLERDLAEALGPDDRDEPVGAGGWAMWPLAAFVPVLAGVLYLIVGTPEAIDPANRIAVAAEAPEAAPQTPDMREVVVRIKERLEESPDDATGWFMLGRAHMTLGEFNEAVPAIRRAYELTGDNPEIMVRLADAIAMSQGGSMAGEPEPLLIKALAMQPDNLQGLWLLGIAQSERGDNPSAIATWQRLLPLLADDPRSQNEVNRLIADAEAAQMSNTTDAAPELAASSGQTDQSSLQVEVTIDAQMAVDLPPDTAIFIYAKAQQGPPMPLAVARHTVSELPITVTLSDADAMMPAMKLSAFDQVIVGARVSFSGNAIAEAGDFFSEVSGISRGQSESVRIEINEVVE
jgi:cytochrome c-type biogenesis protein CcmH